MTVILQFKNISHIIKCQKCVIPRGPPNYSIPNKIGGMIFFSINLIVQVDFHGSGVMSGTAMDLESFQKLGFGDPNL